MTTFYFLIPFLAVATGATIGASVFAVENDGPVRRGLIRSVMIARKLFPF